MSQSFVTNNNVGTNNNDLLQLLNNLPTGSEVVVQNGVVTVRRPLLTTALIISPRRN
jgi:hypothetical protein